jgi:hypothetical protein
MNLKYFNESYATSEGARWYDKILTPCLESLDIEACSEFTVSNARGCGFCFFLVVVWTARSLHTGMSKD